MKKLLILILIWMGVFILLRPVGEFKGEAIGNIIYRKNFVTGIVTADNGDKSYAVEIGESGKSIKQIFTLSPDPDLAVGDKARILYRGGDKEDRILLAPTKPVVVGVKNIYVVYRKSSDSKYYLVKINSDDSITEIAELPELSTGSEYELIRILTDSNGNVYAIKQNNDGYYVPYTQTLYKWNNNGVLQATKLLVGTSEMFGFIAADGYLYTMKANGDELYKRNLSGLETVETINLTSSHRFYYLCFDSGGYLYTYDRDYAGEAAFIKWEIGVGVSEYHQNAQSALSAWADFALLGTNIAHENLGGAGRMATLAISLDSDMTSWAMNDIPIGQAIGVASDTAYWYVIGENTADNKLIVEKYNSSKVLQSTIEISTDYVSGGYRRFRCAITAYPF